MKKERGKYSISLLIELLCCLIGSVAFCTALLPAVGQEVGMADCLLFVLVDLALIFLLSRRWWITPVLLVALAVLGMAAVHFFRLWEPVRAYIEGFIEWYKAACPNTLPYSENGSLFLVHLAFAFPITLVLYLYFRRFPFLLIWVLLGGGLLVWLYFSDPEGMPAVAVLLLIVLLVLFARSNAGSINRKLGQTEKIPSAAMQITALAMAPLIMLFAFGIGPKEDGDWRSKGLVDLVEDMGDVFSFYGEGSSSAGGSFNLSFSGLAPNGWALGGDIEPDNQTILRVKTSTPIFLAGAIYDAYDGRGWYDGEALGRFRLNSPLWRGKRREVFAVDKPAANAAELYEKLSETDTLEISVNVRFRSIFANGKLESLDMKQSSDPSIYFNTQGELFTLEFPDVGASYILKTRCFDREREDFDENMRALLALTASGRDGEYEEIRRRCTAVPDTVEPFVWELVEELTADCDNDYDKALAIETWISDNCSYTQSPGDTPEGRDFVSAFLESREGYCTYYASAMAVMARMAGLPTRYVTGYGLKQADRSKETVAYTATNATAHAWTQVYFYGVGWVDFDPTNWNFYELVQRDEPEPPKEEEPEEHEPYTPEFIDPAELFPELTEMELTPPETPSQPRKRTISGRVLLILLACAAGLFLLFLLLRFILLFFRVESFYYRLTHKYPDNGTRIDVCYRGLLRQLRFLGLEMAPSDTILTFCARVDEALGQDTGRETMSAVCEPVLLYRFAAREPSDEDLRRMCDFYIFLERELRRKLGVRRYILRRMLLGR